MHLDVLQKRKLLLSNSWRGFGLPAKRSCAGAQFSLWATAPALPHGDANAESLYASIRESTIGPQSLLPLLGDWVNPNGGTYSQWTTRSSDFMPAHFRAFARATSDKAYWAGVTSAIQNVVTDIQANESASTGLLPDFIELVGPTHDPQPVGPNFLEGADDGAYWFNAGRDPWRLGVDAILNDDAVSLTQVQKMSQWIRTSTSGDPLAIHGGYKLNGTALNPWQSHFFTAPFAVAAMTGASAVDQQWLNDLYDQVYAADYAIWRNNYSGSATDLIAEAIIPEPTSLLLSAAAAMYCWMKR